MLNSQKKGIETCTHTWNPISGRCHHNCPYCYMRGFWRRDPKSAIPQLKQKYLSDKITKTHEKIFVGSSTDMFGDWVPREWINAVFVKIRKHPDNIFQLLTKNPEAYYSWDFNGIDNCWFGTTVDGTDKTVGNILHLIESVPSKLNFVSFEPLIDIVQGQDFRNIRLLDWIVIGADSSKGAKKPPRIWADGLINEAGKYGIPVWVKDNYGYPETIKEFPKHLKGDHMKTNYHKLAIGIIANHKEMNNKLIVQIAKDRPSAIVNAYNALFPKEWVAEVRKLLPENKLHAVKLCRELTGWSLMEAKKAVEAIK